MTFPAFLRSRKFTIIENVKEYVIVFAYYKAFRFELWRKPMRNKRELKAVETLPLSRKNLAPCLLNGQMFTFVNHWQLVFCFSSPAFGFVPKNSQRKALKRGSLLSIQI